MRPWQGGDAGRVVSLFRGFLREAGQSPQGQQPQPHQVPGQRTYSRADIKRASEDYLRGRIPEAEYQRISADMQPRPRRAAFPIPRCEASAKLEFERSDALASPARSCGCGPAPRTGARARSRDSELAPGSDRPMVACVVD